MTIRPLVAGSDSSVCHDFDVILVRDDAQMGRPLQRLFWRHAGVGHKDIGIRAAKFHGIVGAGEPARQTTHRRARIQRAPRAHSGAGYRPARTNSATAASTRGLSSRYVTPNHVADVGRTFTLT